MLTLFNINPISIKFGPTYNLISVAGGIGAGAALQPVTPLSIPFHDPIESPEIVSLLGWHYKLSTFKGRSEELDKLRTWAHNPKVAISVLIMNGEGGVGKSRLAAEFAIEAEQSGWSAGFIDLRRSHAFPMAEQGTLLVIDYPEEHRSQVTELLHDLVMLGNKHHLRVLLLSRQGREQWEDVVSLSKARGIVENQSLYIGGIESQDDLHDLFNSAQERASEILEEENNLEPPMPIAKDALQAWIDRSSEHKKPLFVIALALYTCLYPKEETLQYSAGRIMDGLVTRELDRLKALARDSENSLSLAQLVVMANISGGLVSNKLPSSFLGAILDINNIPLSFLHEGVIRPLKPDILAALFTNKVLLASNNISEIAWAAVEIDPSENLMRCARLIHDLSFISETKEQSILATALVDAVTDNYKRSLTIRESLSSRPTWRIIPRIQISAYRTLLDNASDEADKAFFLGKLAVFWMLIEEKTTAIAAMADAIAIFRRLILVRSVDFRMQLCACLDNLAIVLDKEDRDDEALAAAKEAVRIGRELVRDRYIRARQTLAFSLANLCAFLRKKKKYYQALEAANESVALYRTLSQEDPGVHEYELAQTLLNLSLILKNVSQALTALQVMHESTEILTSLARTNPVLYEEVFAKSLYEYSIQLIKFKKYDEAMTCILESVEIRKRFAHQNMNLYGNDLIQSLEILVACYKQIDEGDAIIRIQAEIAQINEFLRR